MDFSVKIITGGKNLDQSLLYSSDLLGGGREVGWNMFLYTFCSVNYGHFTLHNPIYKLEIFEFFRKGDHEVLQLASRGLR